MKERFIQNFNIRDLLAGVIVALVSIPISMGYSQLAGLPMIYGLYGSLFPILVFGLFTSSKNYVFGVDAAPAALVGGILAKLSVENSSAAAMEIVPMITLMTACWLIILYILRAGKIVRYISQPVVGGFVTGICVEIILMQIPKLYGGDTGTGELFHLLRHIVISAMSSFNLLSLILAVCSIAVIQLGKKKWPRFPMSVAVMVAGVLLTVLFHVDRYGVRLLPAAQPGLPKLMLPGLGGFGFTDLAVSALTIAVVITSETLLASGGFAREDGYRLDNQKEIRAYALANLVAAFTGCCPVNGSISRTGIVRQFGCGSQWMSISAFFVMGIILLLCTGFIQYLPVPVLVSIVVCALYGACEFDLGRKLYKTSKNEFYIYLAALFGVLIFGTVYGVAIGVILSFLEVIIRAVVPPKSFLGVIPGKTDFYDLERNREARTIEHVVIYRFGGNLFFANIDDFESDIQGAIQPDTTTVVVDTGAVSNIDITAAERLLEFNEELKGRNIRFYLAGHSGKVNDLLRVYGAEELVRQGTVRMTVTLALRDAGFTPPYVMDGEEQETLIRQRLRSILHTIRPLDNTQAEMDWAFGEDSDRFKEELVREMIEHSEDASRSAHPDHLVEALEKSSFGRLALMDEDEILDRLEMRLDELAGKTGLSRETIGEELEKRRDIVEQKLEDVDPGALRRLKEYRKTHGETLRKRNREAYQQMIRRRQEHLKRLEQDHPDLARKLRQIMENGKNGDGSV